jgi:hypothetical protein
VSSPIDRSFGADGVSPYAPKWARDLDNEPRPGSLRHRLQMAGRDYKDPPAMPPNLEVEHFQPPASLAPSLVPDPPIQESWLRESSRALAPGGNGGAFFSYLFAILLAALVAFVIVVELPNILSFMSKQRPATNSFGERFDGDGSRQPIRLAPKATEPQPVSVAHLDSPPPKADPPAEAVNRVVTVPAADRRLSLPRLPLRLPPRRVRRQRSCDPRTRAPRPSWICRRSPSLSRAPSLRWIRR